MNHAARPRRQGGTAPELIVQQWITYLAIVAAVVLGSWALLIVVALAPRYAGRQIPREVLLAAWPGDPRLLARLLSPTAS